MTKMLAAEPDAARAAAKAGVRVRDLTTPAELSAVCRLFGDIWRPEPGSPLVTGRLLRALVKAGNYLAGAFDGDELVGACVGFFGPPSETTLHSHIAGISPQYAGHGVGFAVKLHQRAWALAHGATEICWTFDPLVARNAHFNLVKLAARATAYLPNFYGAMTDGVNTGDDTDRLLIRWDLLDPAVTRACADERAVPHTPPPSAVLLGRSAQGQPAHFPTPATTVRVAVPADIESLRATRPDEARAWRLAVRDTLGAALAAGGHVLGFHAGSYLIATTGEHE